MRFAAWRSSFRFGSKSKERLATCHPVLQGIADRAIELTPIDFTIVHGWRNQATQDLLFQSGASQAPWPTSRHNHMRDNLPCSLAIDVAPIIKGKIPWGDTHCFSVIAGVFFAAATEQEVRLRWGADWDLDGRTTDQTLMDYGHLEIIKIDLTD